MKPDFQECVIYAAITFGSVLLALLAASPAYRHGSCKPVTAATLKPRLVKPYQPALNSYSFPVRPADGLGTGP